MLTYGRVKHAPVEPFRPHFVRYDKVKLTFKAFFKQSVPESGLEHYRIRFVNIMYFMDDDTMTVIEPKVEVITTIFVRDLLCFLITKTKIQF